MSAGQTPRTNPQPASQRRDPDNSWQHIQRDFSGGEISEKMLMRADTDEYKRSVLYMMNMMPTPQGTALRSPGTRFVKTIDADTARIIPYLTPSNERSLLVMTPDTLELNRNITDLVSSQTANILPVGGGVISFRKNICPPFFRKRLWEQFPGWYLAGSTGTERGVRIVDNALRLHPILYKRQSVEYDTVTATAECVVDVATSRVTLDYKANYAGVPPAMKDGGYTFRVELSNDPDFNTTLFNKEYLHADYPEVGSTWIEQLNVELPSSDWTGTLYIRYTAIAQATAEYQYASPAFIVFYSRVFANGETTVEEVGDIVTPYTADDLDDLHFVQSPYEDKELVITHPRHEPRKLFFNTGSGFYEFPAITFANAPASWGINNYPATCTSFQGRLILAGGQTFEVQPGDPIANVSETVWGTKNGEWDSFAVSDPLVASDGIEFTAIYRSPIQWVYGQKTLLIGAVEYEYSARSESVLAPGDIQIYLQSTHGSNNVQPAGFGEAVLFPSDAGRKVRAMRYIRETDGWVAEDLTLLNPEICAEGIRRMIRVRHPHQMCVVLTDSGQLSIFHSESGTKGWSRYGIEAASIQDIAVVQDREGVDVLFMLVRRPSGLHLECIPDLADIEDWQYMTGYLSFDINPPSSLLTGLEHLEGQIVQVFTGDDYVGLFRVENGRINLVNGNGGERPVRRAFVGGVHTSELVIPPPEKVDPGAAHRFVDYTVRTRRSSRPIIDEQRPPDRDPFISLNLSQPIDNLKDNRVFPRGWDPLHPIRISEGIPYALEVLGVFGKVKQGNVRS